MSNARHGPGGQSGGHCQTCGHGQGAGAQDNENGSAGSSVRESHRQGQRPIGLSLEFFVRKTLMPNWGEHKELMENISK